MTTSTPNSGQPAAPRPFRLQRPGTALSLLLCFFLFLLVLTGVVLPILGKIIHRPEAYIRIAAIFQDLLVFILPAIATAMLVTRLPARLLAVDRRPSLKAALLAIGVLICSIPAMNLIIEWNKNWQLPESMAAAETFFRTLEEGAQATTDVLIKGASIPSLILSILIVGLLAGFSEELFFRGALLRILGFTKINKHVVIWLVAFIFSAFHLQLYGFVPRLLLGAFFGYLLWWSGSLWLPVLIHIFNNTVVVISTYISSNSANPDAPSIDTFGSNLSDPVAILGVLTSLILTTLGLCLLRRLTHPKS